MIEGHQKYCHQLLEALLDQLPERKDQTFQAMRYSVLTGGKRLRPLLVFAAGQLSHAESIQLNHAAMSVELIHAYSLIHDDLPAMDDAPMRHGQMSCHQKFGEAIAILAGDALQGLAFEVLAKNDNMKQIEVLAKANRAMVYGQSLDMQAENQSSINLSDLEHIHHHKTGALIEASVQLGLLCGEYDEALFLTLISFAQTIGLAFQIQDDILDVVANPEKLGKMTGSDAKHHKATYVALMGLETAKEKLEHLYRSATDTLQGIPDSETLQSVLTFMRQRDY